MALSISNSLVIGVDGAIGSALFARLQTQKANVMGTTRRANIKEKNIFHLNLSEPASWQFPAVKFDVIYICAGICKMPACEEDPDSAYQVNVTGTTALARYFSEQGASIIFLSSNQVFSGDNPYTATDAPYQPLNEYGRQKAKTEQFIQSHCSQWAIVRLSKVIEDQQFPLERVAYVTLFHTWCEHLLNNEPIEAFHDMWLAPVLLSQVVDVLIKIGKAKHQGIYQLSGTEDISYYEFASCLADRLKRPRSLVKPVSAVEKGIKPIFLPRYTTLDCENTVRIGGQKMPHYKEVIEQI